MKNINLKMKALLLVFMAFSILALAGCGMLGGNRSTAELLSEEEIDGVTFQTGDVFADMSVTTPEGTTYKISEILKEKKAVVINFWFINCGPCEMEFPYMQEAYEEYQDDIEILALNPCDGTDEKVADYKKAHELTFPMAVIDEKWEAYFALTGYPTTVVIDRNGIVSFKHTGMITDTEEFRKLFEFYTAKNYKQTVVEDIDELP